LVVLKGVKGKLLYLKIYLGTGRQSDREIASQKILTLRHLPLGNRVVKKRRAPIWPFLRELRGNLCASKSIWGQAINPTGRLHHKKYLRWGINILLWVIELQKKKGSYLVVNKGVKGKLLYLKIYLGTGRQSDREIASQKIFTLRHKHLPLGNRVVKKEGLLFGRF
jgi:hypothetical protein